MKAGYIWLQRYILVYEKLVELHLVILYRIFKYNKDILLKCRCFKCEEVFIYPSQLACIVIQNTITYVVSFLIDKTYYSRPGIL